MAMEWDLTESGHQADGPHMEAIEKKWHILVGRHSGGYDYLQNETQCGDILSWRVVGPQQPDIYQVLAEERWRAGQVTDLSLFILDLRRVC
jgi:hypothetical protein